VNKLAYQSHLVSWIVRKRVVDGGNGLLQPTNIRLPKLEAKFLARSMLIEDIPILADDEMPWTYGPCGGRVTRWTQEARTEVEGCEPDFEDRVFGVLEPFYVERDEDVRASVAESAGLG
jgi:hypothetical protein